MKLGGAPLTGQNEALEGTIFEPGFCKMLFAGDTVVETLAAVVTRTPDLTAAPAALRLN